MLNGLAHPVQPKKPKMNKELLQPAVDALIDVFRGGCGECAREKKSRADNRAWQEGVKHGKEIVATIARAAINAKEGL